MARSRQNIYCSAMDDGVERCTPELQLGVSFCAYSSGFLEPCSPLWMSADLLGLVCVSASQAYLREVTSIYSRDDILSSTAGCNLDCCACDTFCDSRYCSIYSHLSTQLAGSLTEASNAAAARLTRRTASMRVPAALALAACLVLQLAAPSAAQGLYIATLCIASHRIASHCIVSRCSVQLRSKIARPSIVDSNEAYRRSMAAASNNSMVNCRCFYAQGWWYRAAKLLIANHATHPASTAPPANRCGLLAPYQMSRMLIVRSCYSICGMAGLKQAGNRQMPFSPARLTVSHISLQGYQLQQTATGTSCTGGPGALVFESANCLVFPRHGCGCRCRHCCGTTALHQQISRKLGDSSAQVQSNI